MVDQNIVLKLPLMLSNIKDGFHNRAIWEIYTNSFFSETIWHN